MVTIRARNDIYFFKEGRTYRLRGGSSSSSPGEGGGGGGGGSFIADTLTSANTGVPSGTSLSDLGSTTYTSANNGQSVSNKRFTGRVTLDGVSNMTFTNCKFQYNEYFHVYSINGSSNNTFNYCEWDCQNWNQNGISPVFGPGINLFRCHVYGADNSVRLGNNSSCKESLFDHLCLGIYASHTNCIAIFDQCNSSLVEDCRMDCGYRILGYQISSNVCTLTLDGQMFHCTDSGGASISPAGLTINVNSFSDISRIDGNQTVSGQSGSTITFSVSAGADVSYTAIDGVVICYNWSGAGGLTSAFSIGTDFGGVNALTVRRNRISGGSFACYVPGTERNGYVVRNVDFNNNRLSGGLNGDAAADDPNSGILYWYDNISDPNRVGSGSTIYMPGIGGERRP